MSAFAVFAYGPWVAPILAFAVAAAALGILLWGAARRRLGLPLDYPTGRSLHQRPVSRVGGIAIWAGFLPVALFAPGPIAGNLTWLLPWAFVLAVSFADDWVGVRPAIRLAVQTLAALAFALAVTPE